MWVVQITQWCRECLNSNHFDMTRHPGYRFMVGFYHFMELHLQKISFNSVIMISSKTCIIIMC